MFPIFINDEEGLEKINSKIDLLAQVLGYEFSEKVVKEGGFLSPDEIELSIKPIAAKPLAPSA